MEEILRGLLIFVLSVVGSGDFSFTPTPGTLWEVTVLGGTDGAGEQWGADVYATSAGETFAIGNCGGYRPGISGQFTRCFTSLRYRANGPVTITVSERSDFAVERIFEVREYVPLLNQRVFIPFVGKEN